jgi:hypothetical protein
MSDEEDVAENQGKEQGDAAQRPQALNYLGREVRQKWVTIGKYEAFEGQLALAKLHANGIPAQLYDQLGATVYAGILGSAKLQVIEEDADLANAILAKRTEIADTDDYLDEDWRCPKCRQKKVTVSPLTPWQVVLCVGTLMFAIPFLNRERFCEACGHRWRKAD